MAKKKTDEDDASGSPAKKKRMAIVFGAVALAGGAYKFGMAPTPAPAEGTTDGTTAVEVTPEEGEIIELPEVVINLADPETRFARVGVALVLEKGVAATDFEAESAIAKDAVLAYLSKLTYAQLRDPAVKEQAKAELSALIRAGYDDAKVVRVLFTVLVMQ